MGIKIAIIGAGSAVFSINLVKDICINENFKGSTVVLMDINEKRLAGIHRLCKKYAEELNYDLNVEKTTDREEALRGADFVLHVALDYGHDRLREGWQVARKHGYRFGGSLHIMHDEAFWVNWYQLRLMESVYCDMQRLCPDAWMLLVANPVQAGITYLSRKYPGAKVLGMCHGGYQALSLMDVLGLPREDCSFEVSGVNHFVWLNQFYYKGENAFPLLEKYFESGKHLKDIEADPHPWNKTSSFTGPKPYDLYKRYGVFPIGDTANPGGGAWGWWYHTDDADFMEDVDQWWFYHFSRSDQRLADIWKNINDPDTKATEFFGSVAADEPMIPTIEALAFDVERKVIVNIPNAGNFVEGVPADYECECWAIVNRSGVHGMRMTPQPKSIQAQQLRDRIAPVEMELEALRTGDIHLLEQLVLMDPWTRNLEQAQDLVRDILDMPCNSEMKAYFTK